MKLRKPGLCWYVPELPEGRGAVIHAEIWPSLDDSPYEAGVVRDQAQVIRLAQTLRNLDRGTRLAAVFTARTPAVPEEGWILGVVD